MKVAVQDANILIDMMEGGFCDLWFALNIETHTTDQIICEINEPDQQLQIEVHGTLWILDLLIDRKLLAPRQAMEKLQKLLNTKRRLPRRECQKRLKAWANS